MSNYSFDLLARIGLTQGFLPIFINLSHQSLLDYSPTITFLGELLNVSQLKAALYLNLLLDASVPAAARSRQTEVSDGRGAGHGADPAGSQSRSSGSPQTGRIRH